MTKHVDPKTAGPSTRSEALRPPWFPPWAPNASPQLIGRLTTSADAQLRALNHIVSQRRAELVAQQLVVPKADGNLHGGRILVTHFDSDGCGAATDPSNGYLDLEDIPGWDTWFHHDARGGPAGLMACWVPPGLLRAAEAGAYVIPVKSVWWDDEAPTGRRLF